MLPSEYSVQGFWRAQDHRRILSLTLPLVLANITTPLLGLVDTAVLGHMPDTASLAGASIGALILTQVYWICGFIRMSATGLSAQARGSSQAADKLQVLSQSLWVALLLGVLIFSLQSPLLQAGLFFADAAAQMEQATQTYFSTRVWGAPAALANLALIGWLIGQQCARQVMVIQILANLMNVVLDLVFVYIFNWSVAGVAAASVCAEYFILLSSLWVALKLIGPVRLQKDWFRFRSMASLLLLNNHMLIRNLALQLCLAFLTFQGARYGEQTAATNAILMQFFVLIALGLDAVANAVEALVGEAKGQKDNNRVSQVTWQGLFWSGVFALLYSLIFAVGANQIVALLTNQAPLMASALQYYPIIWLLPLISHWCFLFDGTFVGLTRGKAMMISMLISTLLVYFPVWWGLSHLGNWALWMALLAFLGARGITLGSYFIYLAKRGALVD